MPFKEGNKLGGRTLGAKNKVTQEVRIKFKELLENNLDKIQSDLDQLEPKDRIKLILDLTKFVIPQLKAVELKEETVRNITPIEIKLIKSND